MDQNSSVKEGLCDQMVENGPYPTSDAVVSASYKVKKNNSLNSGEKWNNFNRNQLRAIFIRNLPYHCTHQILREFIVELFPQFTDRIEEVSVRYGQHGKSLQVACVLFTDEDSASRAIEKLHAIRFEGRDLRVTKFDPQAQMESSKVAEIRFSFSSISNTMPRITEKTIRDEFEQAVGSLQDVGIRLHRLSPEGYQTGYGFMTFIDYAHNKAVAEGFHGRALKEIRFECSWSSLNKGSKGSSSRAVPHRQINHKSSRFASISPTPIASTSDLDGTQGTFPQSTILGYERGSNSCQQQVSPPVVISINPMGASAPHPSTAMPSGGVMMVVPGAPAPPGTFYVHPLYGCTPTAVPMSLASPMIGYFPQQFGYPPAHSTLVWSPVPSFQSQPRIVSGYMNPSSPAGVPWIPNSISQLPPNKDCSQMQHTLTSFGQNYSDASIPLLETALRRITGVNVCGPLESGIQHSPDTLSISPLDSRSSYSSSPCPSSIPDQRVICEIDKTEFSDPSNTNEANMRQSSQLAMPSFPVHYPSQHHLIAPCQVPAWVGGYTSNVTSQQGHLCSGHVVIAGSNNETLHNSSFLSN